MFGLLAPPSVGRLITVPLGPPGRSNLGAGRERARPDGDHVWETPQRDALERGGPMHLSRRDLLTLGGTTLAGATVAPSLARGPQPKPGATRPHRAGA